MRRPGPLRVALLVALVTLAPAAAAKPALVRNEAADVAGRFVIPSFGESGWERDLFVVTGALEVRSDSEAPSLLLNVTSGSVTGADRVEVYRVAGGRSHRDFVPQSFANATVAVAPGGSVAWLPPPSRHDLRAPFAVGMFLDLLEGNADLQRVRPGAAASPGFLGSVHEGVARSDALEDGEAFLLPLGASTRFLVHPDPATADNGTAEPVPFTGRDFVVRVVGRPASVFEAPVLQVPFGDGGRAEVAPASADDFARGFDAGAFQDLLARVQGFAGGGNASQGLDTPETRQMEDALGQLAPLLNGILAGSPRGPIEVDGEDHREAGVTVLRFESLTFRAAPGGDEVQWSGDVLVTYTDGELQTSADMVRVGPLFFPALGLVLWVLAAGAWLLARSRNPPADEAKSASLRVPSVVAWVVLLVASLVLWDREVHFLLGTSLLRGGLSGGTAGAVAFLEILPWTAAWVAFGLPVSLAARHGMRFGGLDRRTRGFGRGAGALATWFLGAPYILPIAGEFLRTVIGFFR